MRFHCDADRAARLPPRGRGGRIGARADRAHPPAAAADAAAQSRDNRRAQCYPRASSRRGMPRAPPRRCARISANGLATARNSRPNDPICSSREDWRPEGRFYWRQKPLLGGKHESAELYWQALPPCPSWLARRAGAEMFDGVTVNVMTFTGPQIAEPLQRRAPDFEEADRRQDQRRHRALLGPLHQAAHRLVERHQLDRRGGVRAAMDGRLHRRRLPRGSDRPRRQRQGSAGRRRRRRSSATSRRSTAARPTC